MSLFYEKFTKNGLGETAEVHKIQKVSTSAAFENGRNVIYFMKNFPKTDWEKRPKWVIFLNLPISAAFFGKTNGF